MSSQRLQEQLSRVKTWTPGGSPQPDLSPVSSTSCFADRGNKMCTALNQKYCADGTYPGHKDCPFYKPIEKHQESRKKAMRKIQDLEAYIEASIMRKYYSPKVAREKEE